MGILNPFPVLVSHNRYSLPLDKITKERQNDLFKHGQLLFLVLLYGKEYEFRLFSHAYNSVILQLYNNSPWSQDLISDDSGTVCWLFEIWNYGNVFRSN